MAFRCMNCNGQMVFDVGTQQMRCLHCDSTCAPEEFELRDVGVGEAAGDDGSGLARFSCRGCGASLEGTEDSMIGFCPYCGGQSLVREAGGGHEVERIIPFQIPKEDCEDLYVANAKRVRYLPKELRDPAHIQRFTGIYLPYYEFDADPGEATVTGKKTVVSNSRYDEVAHYRIDASFEGPYLHGAVTDGSRYLDDELSQRTLPFDTSKERPFHPAYLSGFYADTTTAPAEIYYEDASAQASDDVIDVISTEMENAHGISVDDTSKVQMSITGHHNVLYPLWFLTWRKDDRVAYAIVNGESGKVVSDLPLDLRSFWVGSAVVSLALFAVLELLVQPTPLVTSLVSLVASFFMARGILLGLKQEYESQVHAHDKGWTGDQTSQAKSRRKRAMVDGGALLAVVAVMLCTLVVFVLREGLDISSFLDRIAPSSTPLLSVAAFGYAAYVCVRAWKWRSYIPGKRLPVAVLSLLAAVVANAAIVLVKPVNDGWYYLGDALCIVGLVASAVGMLLIYNRATTRPVPKLFDREEVPS